MHRDRHFSLLKICIPKTTEICYTSLEVFTYSIGILYSIKR